MNIKTMENKVKVWLARDKDGSIFMHNNKPKKYSIDSIWMSDYYFVKLNKKEFPSVKWEDDEPTEAYITLAEPQEQPKQEQPQPKQEIDWEQRRYEIAKDVITTYVSKIGFDEFDNNTPQQTETTMKIIELSIKIADALLGTLKQQSK